jgi:hypothetical protein
MPSPAAYQRRCPEESVLYPCIRRCWPRVRERCEAEDRPLPNFVQREFEAYLILNCVNQKAEPPP